MAREPAGLRRALDRESDAAMLSALALAAVRARRTVVEMAHRSRIRLHYGAILGIADIVVLLYHCWLRVRPEEPDWPDRDRFVLSKGHGAPAVYAALADRGFFDRRELESFRRLGSRLQGHPDRLKTPGIEATTGSLGRGLGVAVGMALAARRAGAPWRAYCLVGDGECNEGSIWEAALIAGNQGADRLTVLLDRNRKSSFGPMAGRNDIEPLAAKWADFGWAVFEADGHDFVALSEALEAAEAVRGRPSVVICHTVKGKGIAFVESYPTKPNILLTEEQYRECLEALARAEARLCPAAAPAPAREAACRPGAGSGPARGEQPDAAIAPALEDTTEAFARALVEAGLADERVVVLDSDLADSCRTEPFAAACPGRSIDLGVAEQSLPTVGAGLALAGAVPFANTFAVFALGRGFDMVRQSVVYGRTNVKLVGHAAGLSLGYAGPSHHALEDVALARSLPRMVVLQPADSEECRQMVLWMKDYGGPVYLRLSRTPVPRLHGAGWRFRMGATERLKEGEDLSIFCSGDLWVVALRVAGALAAGAGVQVVNVSTLKPLAAGEVIRHGELTRCALTLEDHSTIGGLGSAVAEIYAEHLEGRPLKRLGVPDTFAESDDCELLRRAYGLADEDILTAARELLGRVSRAPWRAVARGSVTRSSRARKGR